MSTISETINDASKYGYGTVTVSIATSFDLKNVIRHYDIAILMIHGTASEDLLPSGTPHFQTPIKPKWMVYAPVTVYGDDNQDSLISIDTDGYIRTSKNILSGSEFFIYVTYIC